MRPHSEETQRRLAAEREKERMKALNSAFDRLRQKLKISNDKKLTKIKTLRLAIDYIEELQQYLYDSGLEKMYGLTPKRICEFSDDTEKMPNIEANHAFCSPNRKTQVVKPLAPFTDMRNYTSFVSSTSPY